MSIMLTIFYVSVKERMVYVSLCFKLLPQQMSHSKKKCMALCQYANKYKQVVMETLSRTFNGIWRVTYVTFAENSVRLHNNELKFI